MVGMLQILLPRELYSMDFKQWPFLLWNVLPAEMRLTLLLNFIVVPQELAMPTGLGIPGDR